jgi:puromycin-sensitive aminopeptidase
MKNSEVRLSKYVVPIEYDLKLRPDLENFTFEGLEVIDLSILKRTDFLTLHSKELEIETAEVAIGDEKVFAHISYNGTGETVILNFPRYIPTGRTKLTLVFKGLLNDKMRGFYRSRYEIGGKEHYMATTQFEATDARRAFPCFDEPAHKAVFHVSLIIPKGKTAISNTLPVSVSSHDKGFDVVRFSPTPKMSTYLLAFIVGDFEFIEAKTKRGVVTRVYTTPGKVHHAKFALDCAVKTLEFFESYFDIPYPLPTLDMIAIPDFTSLAMENWGAITYREIGLLLDPAHTSAGNKQMIATVIAHEIAHQWFGNLVTMEWWTHLWLNEGFASYISYLAVDHMFPSWDIWTQFCVDDLGIAFRLDALRNTHPIEVEVHHPNEIGEIFDEVSYSKGASVIRMLASFLGEKNFRDGLRHYLKKHSYQNTETFHLWEAFEKASGKPVASMMKVWTGKAGYPVIKVVEKNKNITISQERFFASPVSKIKVKDRTIWPVPLSLGSKKILFKKKSILVSKNAKLEKINMGESGFFRTAYSPSLLEDLRPQVLKKILSPRDRLGLIRDLFALSEAGTIPTTDALNFLSAYKNENDYTVFVELATGLARLKQIFAKTPIEPSLHAFVANFFHPMVKHLGWQKGRDTTHTKALLRSLVINEAGLSGNKEVVKEAQAIFRLLQSGELIDPDIRGAIYRMVAANGGVKEFNTLLTMYKKETLHEEKNRVGHALGYFPDPKILAKVAQFAIGSDVRPQDSVGILNSIAINPRGRNVWLMFVRRNWGLLVRRYGDGGHTLARVVKGIAGSAEERHYDQFKKFFKKNPAPGAERSISQVLERLESNILWLERDYKKVKEFLDKNIA